METVALAVIAGALALGLARVARLPVAPVAIVAGIVLRLVPGADPILVREGLLLAATFLVFSMGVEVDRADVAHSRSASVAAAAVFLAVTAVAAFGSWQVLELDGWRAVYLFLALGSSSTLIVVELLRRRERFFEPVGRFVTGVVLAQDSTVLLLLGLLGPAAAGTQATLIAAGGVAALALGGWWVSRWLAPAVLLRSRASDEEHLLFVLALLFGFGGVAHVSGLPPVVGAYVAGMSLSRFPVGGVARGHLASFADFFTVLFFVLLGAVLQVPGTTELVAEVVFVVVVLVVRPALLLPIARRAGMTVRGSVEAIHLLSPAGEIGLVVVLVGLQREHVDVALLSVVGVVAVFTMSVTPWLSSDRNVARFTHLYPFQKGSRSVQEKAGHVVIIGGGEGGKPLVERLVARGVSVVVIDDDPEVVRELDARGVPALRGDGGDPEVVRRAGGASAVAIVSTMRRMADNVRLLATFPSARVLVRVFSGEQARQVRRLGGIPVEEAELATAAALGWYEALASGPEKLG